MSAGIVLVHGYSGSPENLEPLTAKLKTVYGNDAVAAVCLPGHQSGVVPAFDKQAFMASIFDAVRSVRKPGRPLVLLGHSTGGVIVLAALAEYTIDPHLVVLASVPKRIDTGYLERWSVHRAGRTEMPFISVAQMVSLVNATGAQRLNVRFPVLVLHGSRDELVPAVDARSWENGSFNGPVRTAMIPGADHRVFAGPGSAIAIDAVMQAIEDTVLAGSPGEEEVVHAICSVESEAGRFLAHSPSSARHLAASPSGRTAAESTPALSSHVAAQPTIANIEITTRCNLRCTHCARTIRGSSAEDMPKELFTTILSLLPHAYRITLVGLGETLLHPGVVDFVAGATEAGRRVAVVTNGMMLDEQLSRELLRAGLDSIAFSIDAATQEAASETRPGTDLGRVVENIRRFGELSRSTREISMAVFSAVSAKTASSLVQLMHIVAGLKVHVMMLTDLNFRENIDNTLWKNADDAIAEQIRSGVSEAFKKGLPVLSVRGLEEFGLWKRYRKFLLLPPDVLFRRSARHAWCFSPWQTVPVNVRGEVTLCDCQPEIKAGNLLNQPVSAIWNGEVFVNHRERMVSGDPPAACRICPRF